MQLTDTITLPVRTQLSEEMPISLVSDSWLMILFLLIFIFFSISYHRSARYLRNLFMSLFKVNHRDNLFDETTINENQLKFSLFTITFYTEAILLYQLFVAPLLTNSKLVLPCIVGCAVICWLYYLIQKGLYSLLGNIFSSSQQTYIFKEKFTSINLVIGLFFTPLALLAIFIPTTLKVVLILYLIIYFLSRFIIIFNGVRIFLPHIFGLLYLILYLCALEILPLFYIKTAVIEMYRFFELNLILS